jgi:hypothetical protein
LTERFESMVLQRHSAEPKHKVAGTRVAPLQVQY